MPSIRKDEVFRKVGYIPHSDLQRQVHDSTARFRVVDCGRRWGKSTSAGHDFTTKLFLPDKRYWIVGPTYSLGEKEFRVIYEDLKKLGLLNRKDVRHNYNVRTGDMRIQMPWDTSIEVRSAEKPDSLVGEGLDGVIMSEAAKHKRETWERHIGPALSDKRGEALFPSTPDGFNFFYDLFEMGQDSAYPDYQSWQAPTWTNEVMYPGGRQDPEILRIESTVSKAWFNQEIGAEFTSREGLIYDEYDENIHLRVVDFNPNDRQYCGVDFGFTNPFVCLDAVLLPNDHLHIWREYYVSGLTTADHGDRLRSRPDNPIGYRPRMAFCDPRDPEGIITLGIKFAPAIGRNVPWINGIESVKRRLAVRPDGSVGLTIDPSCRNLRREMKSLKRVDASRDDKNAREGQHDYDDHACDALRYLIGELDVNGASEGFADTMRQLASQRSLDAAANGNGFFTYDSGGFTLGGKVPF